MWTSLWFSTAEDQKEMAIVSKSATEDLQNLGSNFNICFTVHFYNSILITLTNALTDIYLHETCLLFFF